jgi:D-alanyl-D-alanine carboxypeptidase
MRKVKNPINYFVKKMNECAKKLGLWQTNFANPHGLANKMSKSSAFDIAKLCCETMKHS